MKRIRLVWICLLIGLFSCKQEKQEVVDLNDVLPSSERYAEGAEKKEDTLVVHFYDSLTPFSRLISDTLQVNDASIQLIDSTWLPDRFQHRFIQKWSGQINEMDVSLAYFTFTDSLSMKNTLFNWLDCFGNPCKSLQLFEEAKLLRNRSFVIYSTEKELVYLESKGRIDENTLLTNLNRLNSKNQVKYVITQNLNNKTQWWMLDKKVWSTIKKEEL